MAKKVTNPTGADSDMAEGGRERLGSGILGEEGVGNGFGGFNNSGGRPGLEGISELPRRLSAQGVPHPSSLESFGAYEAPLPVTNQLTFAIIQQTQKNIMDAELTAIQGGGGELTRDNVLNVLKGAHYVLKNLQQSVVSSAPLTRSMQTYRGSEGEASRAVSPESRMSLRSTRPFTLIDPSNRPIGHEMVIETEGPGLSTDSPLNPGLVLAVPNQPTGSSLNSPRKVMSPERGFKPLSTTFVLPSFNREGNRASHLVGRTAENSQSDPSSGEKSVNAVRPHLYPQNHANNVPMPVDAKDKAACDRLSSFLKGEVKEKGDVSLLRMLHEIQKQC